MNTLITVVFVITILVTLLLLTVGWTWISERKNRR